MLDGSLKAVVAGTGFGARAHVPALRSAGYEVLGIIGQNPEKTRTVADATGVPQAFVNIEQALDLEPDVVAIATPPHTHAPLTRLAFAAGAHVVCEKPFTRTLDEAQELCELSRVTGKIGLLCHEFRYVPSTTLFRQMLLDGLVGEPRLATFTAHGGLVADPATPRPDWWLSEELGGGWFGASGSHGIDRIRDWYGEFTGVAAHLFHASDRPGSTVDDSFVIQFRTESGVTGTFESTAAAWGKPLSVTKVVGTKGTMWIEDAAGSGIVETISGPVHFADGAGQREIPVPTPLNLPDDEHVTKWPRVIGSLSRLYQDLGRLAQGQPIKQGAARPATFEDGLINMQVMDAVRQSSAAGGKWINLR